MSKLIICVKSCHRDLSGGYHNPIRSTWGAVAKASGVEVRFFVGRDDSRSHYERDEIVVDAGDTYADLPFKTREICRWATGKIFDHIFICDTDTYIYMKHLLESGYERYDYLGHMLHPLKQKWRYETTTLTGEREVHDPCYTWASGGVGYMLSKDAVKEVAYDFPNSWAEDLWVGQVVGPHIQIGTWLGMNTRENNYTGNLFSWHFPRDQYDGKPYDPSFKWMEKMHELSR